MVMQMLSGNVGSTPQGLTRAAIARKLAHQTRIQRDVKKALKNYAEEEGIKIKSKYELSDVEAKKIITEVFHGKSPTSRKNIMMRKLKLKYKERPKLEALITGGGCTEKEALAFIKKHKLNIYQDNQTYVNKIQEMLAKGDSMEKIRKYVKLQGRRKWALIKSGRATAEMGSRTEESVSRVTTTKEKNGRRKITGQDLGIEEQGKNSGFALKVDESEKKASAGVNIESDASVVEAQKNATDLASGLGVKAGEGGQKKSNVINVDFVNKKVIKPAVDDIFAEEENSEGDSEGEKKSNVTYVDFANKKKISSEDQEKEEKNDIDNSEQYKKASNF